MLVQIVAPIAAGWAVNAAASDALPGAICAHALESSSQDGPADQQPMHGPCCTLCSAAHIATPASDPQADFSKIERPASAVIWFDSTPAPPPIRAASNAQARGPPVLS